MAVKKGIGAIPSNLIIKSGGFTYYPLNQFEIDGTVAVELYRQDTEGEKKKIFTFKGEKDELKMFKAKFPVIKEMRSYNEYGTSSSRVRKMISTNTSDSYLLYKLAENLHEEAANFNKKIKTGGKLTLNELNEMQKFVNSKALGSKKITPAQIKIIKPEWDKMQKFLKEFKPKQMAAKKSAPTKAKVTIKVTSKKPLTLAAKKKLVKRVLAERGFLQTGGTNIEVDRKRTALPVGVRISKKGNKYSETRANRSDRKQGGKRGTWL
jgi:hypothetical protein